VLGHRIKVHAALKDQAVKMGADLLLGKAVTQVDPATGSIKLVDGSHATADVVIGADGVHSVCRKAMVGDDWTPFSSGKSAFRFLVARRTLLDDPRTRKYVEQDGELVIVYDGDRRLVMYPTSDNAVVNFVCIHPEEETSATSSGNWDNKANKDLLLKVFEKFHDDFHAVLEKVDENSLKVWRLMDMVSDDSRLFYHTLLVNTAGTDQSAGTVVILAEWQACLAR
jgi:2-polyprenyl-6-methoxyphenol hydroxylase-like FAD-dependent oxidoreductase